MTNSEWVEAKIRQVEADLGMDRPSIYMVQICIQDGVSMTRAEALKAHFQGGPWRARFDPSPHGFYFMFTRRRTVYDHLEDQ